ncbi:hypothetical protein [Methylotuvimicrobium buryatense]|uniref:Fibronectin type-III domain-containing protein n=1 Tax=Methylotuvimicrobium buryatense TaxID=95641 RepID=A0A4P9UUJ2_METBY|nr:hypothetical protein [Methylotuvimicrobium buryatense]QCW84360.1 hypothetical protein EQU24_20580 [Methylotuvimicrobium buryatense]
MLKISKPNNKDFYYLSYRQAIGDYGQLSTNFTRGINIHRYRGSGYAATTHLQTLSDGGVFNDDVNGITVQQIARNGNTATVQVSFGCAATAPQVSVAPVALALRSGQSVNFSVSVTNQDSTSCGSGSYAIDYEGYLPGSVTPAEQILNAGQTGNATLQADAGGALEGSYPVDVIVTALNADDPNLAHTTGSATVIVDGTPPNVPAGLTASVDKQGRVNLSWQASTDALSGLAGYTVYRDGAIIANVTNTGFTDSNTTSGTVYSYSAGASDAAGSTKSGGGGNNGRGKK